ncbi:endonuclease domain-containing protein [Geodermatophilus sp. SYSU D00758]
MPRPAAVPDCLHRVPFRGSEAVRSGLLSRRQLDGSTWRRLLQDVYVHHAVPVTHELRVRAAALRVPLGVATGASAAVLWGVALAGDEDDVELTVPRGHHHVRVAGIRVRRADLPAGEVLRRRGIRVTTPEATAVRVAAALPADAGVVAVDQLVATGVVDLATIRELAAVGRGPGSARAREVVARADGLAESPQETRLRLLIGRGGLPVPVAQYQVQDERGVVARVDFAWPDRRIAVEYDGTWHAEPGQFARDRRRLNRLQAAGWRVVFVTAADLHRPDDLITRLAAALAAGPSGTGARTTTTPPCG